MASKKSERAGYPKLSADRVSAYRLKQQLSVEELKEQAQLSEDTWMRIRREKPIWRSTARRLAEKLTDGNLLPLLHPSSLVEFTGGHDNLDDRRGLADWEPGLPLVGYKVAANGLCYHVCQVKHRFEPNRYGRAKRYDVAPLPTQEQDRMVNYLVRHGEICNRMAGHARFPGHITTVPDSGGEAWWVIDEWTAGETLSEVLYRGALSGEELPRVMRQIAEGLQALHEARIIRRELSPEYVILRAEDRSVLLTDFELGKLLDGSPTVSKDFPGNPYQAPEIGAKPLTDQDKHVDLYSWGRILLHAATGGLPPKGEEADQVNRAPLSPKIRGILTRCLGRDKERPQSADEVIQAIRRWK